ETVRYDGNFGYVLLGDGKGSFAYEKSFEPYIPTDAKDIKTLTIANNPCYVVVSNNTPIELFKYQ
ncbi:MAG: hypothetical protein R2776_10275, partial [Flavobacteriaceae bacterium]